MDGRHVVFGKVLSGMDVVYKIEAEGKQSGVPKTKVVISDSGELTMWIPCILCLLSTLKVKSGARCSVLSLFLSIQSWVDM